MADAQDALVKNYEDSVAAGAKEYEDSVAAGAKEYEDSVAAGRKFIRQRWSSFGQQTREWLTASGHFNERGSPQNLEDGEVLLEIERLEYDLGVLQCCVDVPLPPRGKAYGLVPWEARSDDVLTAAASMMYGNPSHEPAFLSFALVAVRMHQIANLLDLHLPAKPVQTTDRSCLLDAVYRLLGIALTFILVLASPALLGLAITSAAQGEAGGASVALYGVALALLLAWWAKSLNKDAAPTPTPHEVAYHDWLMLGVGPWLAGGAGTAAYLENMMRKGAKVPPIAIDLCAMLTARMTR